MPAYNANKAQKEECECPEVGIEERGIKRDQHFYYSPATDKSKDTPD